ncbi:hypothetical protein B0H14DRAFT_2604617 [Mycena olivaceomarginata]|nr:hypothetical protein B0H14DRAFT_2604617 [Mycena olivaceomarginata]
MNRSRVWARFQYTWAQGKGQDRMSEMVAGRESRRISGPKEITHDVDVAVCCSLPANHALAAVFFLWKLIEPALVEACTRPFSAAWKFKSGIPTPSLVRTSPTPFTDDFRLKETADASSEDSGHSDTPTATLLPRPLPSSFHIAAVPNVTPTLPVSTLRPQVLDASLPNDRGLSSTISLQTPSCLRSSVDRPLLAFIELIDLSSSSPLIYFICLRVNHAPAPDGYISLGAQLTLRSTYGLFTTDTSRPRTNRFGGTWHYYRSGGAPLPPQSSGSSVRKSKIVESSTSPERKWPMNVTPAAPNEYNVARFGFATQRLVLGSRIEPENGKIPNGLEKDLLRWAHPPSVSAVLVQQHLQIGDEEANSQCDGGLECSAESLIPRWRFPSRCVQNETEVINSDSNLLVQYTFGLQSIVTQPPVEERTELDESILFSQEAGIVKDR